MRFLDVFIYVMFISAMITIATPVLFPWYNEGNGFPTGNVDIVSYWSNMTVANGGGVLQGLSSNPNLIDYAKIAYLMIVTAISGFVFLALALAIGFPNILIIFHIPSAWVVMLGIGYYIMLALAFWQVYRGGFSWSVYK